MKGILGRIARTPAWLWLCLAVLLAGLPVLGWQYGADDLLFLRTYTEPLPGVPVRWEAVAGDFHGPWKGNPHLDFFRPVVSLSLALDFTLFGARPGGHALVNLAIHLASALCLLALARRVLPDRRSALLTALLFGLTPLAHENLAWAVGRCHLTLCFGLLSGLCFLRGLQAKKAGLALQLPVLLLQVLNLCTMESAVAWLLFPLLCLLLVQTFQTDLPPLGFPRVLSLVLPQLSLLPAYLGFRLLVLGSLAGGRSAEMFPEGLLPLLTAPFIHLFHSLAPQDHSFLEGRASIHAWLWLCLLPPALGLLAPLHWRDPRSAGYRKALLLLLGFWLLSRLPSLSLWLGSDLGSSRTAYYAYPPIALCLGLLLATNRYSLWLGLLCALAFGFNLHHRLEARGEYGARGQEARNLLREEARRLGALTPAEAFGREEPRLLCFLNQCDGSRAFSMNPWAPEGTAGASGAPVYYPGDMALALYPPLLPERLQGFTVHGLVKRGELRAAAAFGLAAGGIAWVRQGSREELGRDPLPSDPVSRHPVRILQWFQALPRGGLRPVLTEGGGMPELRLPGAWRGEALHGEARPVLLLCAGPENLRLPMEGGWPPEARRALLRWARLHGPDAPFALFVETRLDPRDPSTARARSPVLFGRIP